MPSIKSEEAVNRLVKAAIARAPVEYRWRDRGGMSSESHLREQCRKYVKKANRDFAGLKDRWVKDPLRRANMIDNGWDWDSLDFIQKVADTRRCPTKAALASNVSLPPVGTLRSRRREHSQTLRWSTRSTRAF